MRPTLHPLFSNSQLTREGVGAGGLDIGVSGGIAAGAGAGGAVTGAKDGEATGTDFDKEMQMSLGGSDGVARIGVIHGASRWCQVTSRHLMTLPVSASRSR